jgi:hypothetical protein
MSNYKMPFGAVLVFATGLSISAAAKCVDVKICWELPTAQCKIYHSVCTELSPEGAAEHTFSIEVQDLSREELQKTLDFFAT